MQKAAFCLLLAFFAIALFYHLADPPLEAFDDASYADISRNIASSGDWLHLRWFGSVPFLEKPPLYFWITASLFKFAGVSELNARLFPAFCGIALLAFVYIFARIHAPRVALLAPILLLTVSQFWIYSSRAMLDIPVTVFVSMALGAFYMAEQEFGKGWYVFYGTAVALAILTKGVVGLIPVIVSGVFLTATSWRRICDRGYLLGTGIAFTLGAPWHLWMSSSYGRLFWREYIGYHVLARFFGNIAVNQEPISSYIQYLMVRETMFTACGILFVIVGAYLAARRRDRFSAFLLIWTGTIFAIFSASHGKLPWYMLPLYPPVAIGFAYAVEHLTSGFPRMVLVGLGIILAADATLIGYRFFRDQVRRITNANPGEQVRTISRDLKNLTSPKQRISIFDFGSAVSPVSFYAGRPVRFIFDNPRTGAMYAQIPTSYESYGAVRGMPLVEATALVERERGILLLEKSEAERLTRRGLVIAQTRDLVALQLAPPG